jgi:hypothetical protein
MGSRFTHRVWVDFEFVSRPGEPPDVVCCAFKLDDAPTRVLWRDELGPKPPYPIDDDTAVVSFTQAEWSCHLALRWKLPKHVIDLNCELRMMSNGMKLPAGHSLIGFCRWLGLDAGDAAVKDAIRSRIIKGWPFTPEEKGLILKYAGSDVAVTALLFDRIERQLDYDRALHRGDWSWVSALMERHGVPINGPLFREIADPVTWNALRDALVPELDQLGVYVKHNDGAYHFDFDIFDDALTARGIPWRRTETGRLAPTAPAVPTDRSSGPCPTLTLSLLSFLLPKKESWVMDDDFWTQISLTEFNDRTERAYAPVTPFNVALEHWTDRQGVSLGVVTLDRVDNYYGIVVLGRDERGQFRAIDVVCSHPSLDKARDALKATMRKVAESSATIFPQDYLQ